MDYKKLLAHTVTTRLQMETAEYLGKEVQEGKFRSMPEAIRHYIQAGMRFEKLQKIMNDPEKRAEFEKNIRQAFEEQFHDESLETLDYDQLDAIYAKIGLLKDKKLEQLTLDVG